MHKQLIAGPTYKDMQPLAPEASVDYPVPQMFLACGRKRERRKTSPESASRCATHSYYTVLIKTHHFKPL